MPWSAGNFRAMSRGSSTFFVCIFCFGGGGGGNIQAGSEYAYQTIWSPRLISLFSARATLLFSHVKAQA